MKRQDYSFTMLPRPPLLLHYAQYYGKPYRGPWVWIATRRVRGRTSDYDAYKTATGRVHRNGQGNDPLTETFDEIDRLCRLVGVQSQWDSTMYYGLRIYGHERCSGGKDGEYVTLDTPGIETLFCAACGKELVTSLYFP